MLEDPTYKSIYPKGDKTELFPSEMQATANYIQTDEICKKRYEKLYKYVALRNIFLFDQMQD